MEVPVFKQVRVVAFGAFDPLNEGQINFLQQAKALGNHLTVVVAHQGAIMANKQRDQRASEEDRLAVVRALPFVDEAMLGRKTADRYHLLREIDFDVIAMGYNQKPPDEEVRAALNAIGKREVEIVRLQPYKPEQYPSD